MDEPGQRFPGKTGPDPEDSQQEVVGETHPESSVAPRAEGTLTDLAREAAGGHGPAFRTLVESLTRTLVAMAYRYTRDWELARDLTQETWIRVHENLDRYDPARSFTSWLYTIHRNGCRDHLKRSWVRREELPGDEGIQKLQGVAPESPEQDLERKEFQARILAAADGLSESQREVFLRVDVEQGDQKAVARALGIRFGTLRTTLHFARKRVAAVLRDMEAGT